YICQNMSQVALNKQGSSHCLVHEFEKHAEYCLESVLSEGIKSFLLLIAKSWEPEKKNHCNFDTDILLTVSNKSSLFVGIVAIKSSICRYKSSADSDFNVFSQYVVQIATTSIAQHLNLVKLYGRCIITEGTDSIFCDSSATTSIAHNTIKSEARERHVSSFLEREVQSSTTMKEKNQKFYCTAPTKNSSLLDEPYEAGTDLFCFFIAKSREPEKKNHCCFDTDFIPTLSNKSPSIKNNHTAKSTSQFDKEWTISEDWFRARVG
ncbi:hypothetical protein F8388_007470, partial [Cannabis sativa]